MRLTAERLRELFNYDPDTGEFKRKIRRSHQLNGSVAGSPHPKGYVAIQVDGKKYLAHRLAWLYVYGMWPDDQIDHTDRNKRNNRISNLREATNTQNQANSKSSSKSGLKGAYRIKNGWFSTVQFRGENIYLGYYSTAEKAHAAYMKKSRELHGEFASAGA